MAAWASWSGVGPLTVSVSAAVREGGGSVATGCGVNALTATGVRATGLDSGTSSVPTAVATGAARMISTRSGVELKGWMTASAAMRAVASRLPASTLDAARLDADGGGGANHRYAAC